MKVGDKVRHKYSRTPGVIVKDMGCIQPYQSNAPLAESYPAEQAWRVEFYFDVKLSGGRRGYTDQQGCWESDLELVEST